MKKLALVVGALGATFVLGGCPIWIDTDTVDDPPPCGWGCAPQCETNSECDAGYWCNDGSCDATWYCDVDGSCPDGFVCDERETCVPGEGQRTPCDDDGDCQTGYCGDDGFCVETGACEAPGDCAAVGPGLTCDDRGVCVPDEGPCPDGSCGCTDDRECGSGFLCINSRCTDLNTICVFDFECGDGACIDNECHASCAASDGECPTGQTCLAGLCVDREVGIDGCVFDEDCGDPDAFRCINATCHDTCSGDEQCLATESCRSGVCRPDVSPSRECTSTDQCDDEMVCLRGFCRMPCAGDINCTGEASHCGPDGFCLFDEELAPPECQRASDCAEGRSCRDGRCVS